MTVEPSEVRPPPFLERHALTDRTIWWSGRHGRGFVAGPDAEWTAGSALRVAQWGRGDPVDGVWVRHRASVGVPGGVWAPDPRRPGPGGPAYRLVPLSPLEEALYRAVDGRKTGGALARDTGADLRTLRGLAGKLTDFGVQAVQVRERPARAGDPSLSLLLGPPRPPNDRTADQHDERGATSLVHWHEASIVDGTTHFDDRETTFAHAFGLPHPALGGERYGARLRRVLAAHGFATDGPVLEVGCGTGELATAWGEPADGAYRRVDLSPELLRVQQLAAPFSEGIRGDLTDLPLPDASVPLLLCNEVIADLEATPVGNPEAERARRAHGLPPLEGGYYNTGAWRALEEAARVLSPGGHALFTEFGVLEGPVAEAVQLDHPEVAIHFGHLEQLARHLGLEARVLRLDDLIRPEPDARWLSRTSWLAVRSWAFSQGIRLPARAWTPESLADRLPGPCTGLSWVPLDEEGPGPLITRFWALLLHRPR